MSFEDEYLDVLQNIEFGIVTVHERVPELLDYDVDAALSALIARYKAEQGGRVPPPIELPGRRQQVYDEVAKVCEWRLGRGQLADGPAEEPTPKTVDEILACLRRIKRSVARLNRQRGRQGYLSFIRAYVR